MWGREVIEFFSLELMSPAGSLFDVKTEGRSAERAGAGRSVRHVVAVENSLNVAHPSVIVTV